MAALALIVGLGMLGLVGFLNIVPIIGIPVFLA